ALDPSHHAIASNMATPVHCLLCFESLAATLDKRKALSLAEVHDLWEQYQVYVCEEDDDDEEDNIEGDMDAEWDQTNAIKLPIKRHPDLERLAVPSPAST